MKDFLFLKTPWGNDPIRQPRDLKWVGSTTNYTDGIAWKPARNTENMAPEKICSPKKRGIPNLETIIPRVYVSFLGGVTCSHHFAAKQASSSTTTKVARLPRNLGSNLEGVGMAGRWEDDSQTYKYIHYIYI